MSISALTGTTPSSTTTNSNQLHGTKDEFLKLFMAQLQHQDPLDPKSGGDMVAQLAQMSAVEQAEQTNAQLAALTAQQTSDSSAALANLVGRTCDATAGSFEIDHAGATPPPLDIASTGPMVGASVQITDADGKVLRTLPIPDGATAASVAWDGKDASGKPLPAGSYNVSIDTGKSGSTITSRWHGSIDSVELTENGPRLRMGGVLLSPADIRTIGASL